MTSTLPAGSRISGPRLASFLGSWRRPDGRGAAVDLAAALRVLFLDGRLPVGTRLPAERELAEALGVSRTMVTTAMDSLRENGMVASRRGAGSWISVPGKEPDRTGWSLHPPSTVIDMAHASPFAPPGLAAAVDRARLRLPELLNSHGYQSFGLPEPRELIARRYTERGLPTTPDQVMITNGAQHALTLALRLHVGPGQRVLVDNPTYPTAVDGIRAAHALPVAVPLDRDGWDLDSVEATLRQAAPRLAYFVVDFQNPTGLRMSAPDRERLAHALRRARTLAVVDETLVELDLEGDPVDAPPPLAAFAEDWVILAGSASKAYWGGLRMGWLRAPAELVHRLGESRPSMDLGSPVFEQLVLAELLADGEAILAPRREEFARRRDFMVELLAEHCPEWTVNRPPGGLNLWCDLGKPLSTQLAMAVGRHSVQAVPGSRFAAHGGLEQWMRLPYTLPDDQLAEAVRRIGAAWSGLADPVPPGHGIA
ncbi:PLP-dependent aminotransferase family protein [Allokutzneria multivorans]|uniref:PLP-dependent aminotransferase family protein n=1 Tax=Allokutzneria multivorans TaxID=1142134 RepID=A0ABP7RTC7_9PSEU